MADLDVAEMARALERTSANLKRHIEAEGKKIGDAHGLVYAKAADERIKAKDAELQRAQALITEFRRQREPLERAAEKANRLATVIRRAHYAGDTTINVKSLLDIISGSAPQGSKEN